MYRIYNPVFAFNLAVKALAVSLFDNLEKNLTIKSLAERYGASEKQLHIWKRFLSSEGLKLFEQRRPGRRKKSLPERPEGVKILIYESINRLLLKAKVPTSCFCKKAVGNDGQDFKEEALRERRRLKEEYGLSYQEFSRLTSLAESTLRLWQQRESKEGKEGLKTKSRAPKRNAKALPPEIIQAIQTYGKRRQRRGSIRNLSLFSQSFRERYQKLLIAYGHLQLSARVIGRYLKEIGLYQPEKKEKREAKRGGFRSYFPLAQGLIDTTHLFFLGLWVKVITILDGFSRKILSQAVFKRETSGNIIRCLKSALAKSRRFLSLLSDHGRPYKTVRVRKFLQRLGILKLLCSPYYPQGKAPIERYFRTLKESLREKSLFLLALLGLWTKLKERIILLFLNLVLAGQRELYNKKALVCLGGESPEQRIKRTAGREVQKATGLLLEEQARKDQTKKELLSSLLKEFKIPAHKGRTKNYLCRFWKKALKEAAEALRKRLIVSDLPPVGRFYYIAKVARSIEEREREAEKKRAQTILLQQKARERWEENFTREKEAAAAEKKREEENPEIVLKEAIEWYLCFEGNPFRDYYYKKRISTLSQKLFLTSSASSAGLLLGNICSWVKEKDSLKMISKEVSKMKLDLPSFSEEEKERVINIIQESYQKVKSQLPKIQNFRQLWKHYSGTGTKFSFR